MSAHTPGEWEVALHGTTPGNTSIEVQTTTGLPVALMSYCGRAEENARLIASAPDLLAALAHCDRLAGCQGNAADGSLAMGEIRSIARAAIAKAGGGK